MNRFLKDLLRWRLSSGNSNLVSFEKPFPTMRELLAGRSVSTILLAGASNGRSSRKLLRYFPGATIHAFEPNPVYKAQLAQLSKYEPAIVPHFYAVSDERSSIKLQIADSPAQTSIYSPGTLLKKHYPDESRIVSVEEVEAITIDEWAHSIDDIPVELMKFDIQGCELKAMRGAEKTLRSSTEVVYTEILLNPLYEGGALFSQIDQLLREFGFVLYDIYKPQYTNDRLLLWANALYAKQSLFAS